MQSRTTTIRFADDYTREVIDAAAVLLGQTRTNFLLSVARQKAEEVIESESAKRAKIEGILALSAQASTELAKRLVAPREPSQKLVKAMQKFAGTALQQ